MNAVEDRPLTFGVEVEHVMIRYCPPGASEGYVSVENSPFIQSACRQLAARMRGQNIKLEKKLLGKVRTYQTWGFADDSSVMFGIIRDCITSGIELISRPLPANELGFREVQSVLNVVNEANTDTNHTTGLHVRVGDGDHGLSFQTVKNLALLFIAFEHVLDSFHPRHRKAVDNVVQFCKPLSESSGFRRCSTPIERYELAGLITDPASLDYLVNEDDRHWTLNTNLRNGSWRPKTVEFRQHDGSTDPVVVNRWVRFCVGLVLFAQRVTAQDLDALVRRHVHDKWFTSYDLLRAVGQPDLVREFQHHVWDNVRSFEDYLGPNASPSFDCLFRQDFTNSRRDSLDYQPPAPSSERSWLPWRIAKTAHLQSPQQR